jgi:hypothetical protein
MEELWQTNEIYQDRIDEENNHHHYYEVKIKLYDNNELYCDIECDDRYDDLDDYSIVQRAVDYLDIDEDEVEDYQINVISRWEME